MITVDYLINTAVTAFFVFAFLSIFYTTYISAEEGIRKTHLRYLSQVIEDRMKMCHVVDNIKIYAPYRVSVDCEGGSICWRDVCYPVSCSGGGEGSTFILRNCVIYTLD